MTAGQRGALRGPLGGRLWRLAQRLRALHGQLKAQQGFVDAPDARKAQAFHAGRRWWRFRWEGKKRRPAGEQLLAAVRPDSVQLRQEQRLCRDSNLEERKAKLKGRSSLLKINSRLLTGKQRSCHFLAKATSFGAL